MREITHTVNRQDTDGILTLRELARRMFPGELVEVVQANTSTLAVRGDMSDYVIDLLRAATEDPAFEPYRDWKARKEDQGQLDLGQFSTDDPIHATAG